MFTRDLGDIPFGKHTNSYGKSPFFAGEPIISGNFQQQTVSLPEGKCLFEPLVLGLQGSYVALFTTLWLFDVAMDSTVFDR